MTSRRRGALGLMLRARSVSKYVDGRTLEYSELLRRSGESGNPKRTAEKSVVRALLSALILVPAACAAGVLLSPWFLFACALPLAFLAGPGVLLRDRAVRRMEGVDHELPFLSVIASVLGSAGVSLFSILERVSQSDDFPYSKREALRVRRDVAVFGLDHNDAFERLAASHPSKKFAEFLLGYASRVRAGGDVPAYLSAQTGAMLQDLEEGWDRYVTRVGIVGSLMVAVFGVVPLLLLVVGIFSPQTSVIGLTLFASLAVPLCTVALVYLSGRLQPYHEIELHGKAGRSLLLSFAAGAAGTATGALWLGLALALLVLLTSYGLSVRGELRASKAVDEGLWRFLDDLLDYTRQEYDLTRAVVSIERSCKYNRDFSLVLSGVASQLKGGTPLDQVKVDGGSRLGKLVFLMLGEMGRSGGGTVDTVYQVSRFARELASMRRQAASEVKPYLILSYLVPCLLAFGVTFVEGVVSAVGRSYGPRLLDTGLFLQSGTTPSGLTEVSYLLIVVSAASLGLVGAKIADLSVKNTLRGAVNVGIATAAIVIMATFGSHFLGQLFAG